MKSDHGKAHLFLLFIIYSVMLDKWQLIAETSNLETICSGKAEYQLHNIKMPRLIPGNLVLHLFHISERLCSMLPIIIEALRNYLEEISS